jgi:hypothetical protein
MTSSQGAPVGVVRSGASASAAAVAVAISLVLGPPAFVSLLASVVWIVRGRRHWHEAARLFAAVSGAVVLVLLVAAGNPFAFTYSGYGHWWHAPSFSLQRLVVAMAPAAPLAVPIGALLGACVVGVAQARAVGAEWHPLERRRQEIDDRRLDVSARRLLADVGAHKQCQVAPLGVAKDGDLDSWRSGPYAVLDPGIGSLGLAVAGAPGAGKTRTLLRLVRILAQAGRGIVIAECKGTDPDLRAAFVAAYLEGAQRNISVHVFPDEPLNGWIGSSQAIANRLLAMQFSESPFYAAMLATTVPLAVSAPPSGRVGACTSSSAFMARLTPDFLLRAYAGTDKANDVAALKRNPQLLDGVRLRFAGFFDSLAGSFDGERSFGDSDVTILTIPTLAARADGEAAMLALIEDVSQFCVDPARKPRLGADLTVIIDEFSAVTAAAPAVINLAERVRDVGGQVIVSAQSYEGLGSDADERRRLLGALSGGVILHQCVDPEEFCKLGGTERKVEQSWQLEDTAHSGLGSMRMGFRMKVPADAVRQARVGEAWAISGGRYLHLHVVDDAPAPEAMARARELVAESRSRGLMRQRVNEQNPKPPGDSRAQSSADDGEDPWGDE